MAPWWLHWSTIWAAGLQMRQLPSLVVLPAEGQPWTRWLLDSKSQQNDLARLSETGPWRTTSSFRNWRIALREEPWDEIPALWGNFPALFIISQISFVFSHRSAFPGITYCLVPSAGWESRSPGYEKCDILHKKIDVCGKSLCNIRKALIHWF